MKANPFPYSIDNKRYHTLNYYNRNKYGCKVQKAVLECGMTCPNIDGTKGTGGCIFCDGGSGYFTNPNLTITEQLELEKRRIAKKFGDSTPIIAYFQANTNTYTSSENLRRLISEALSFPDISGIAIGTRADCLPDDIIELLADLNTKTDLTVELGMQTMHESTLSLINRCYSHEEFVKGYLRLKEHGIRVCIHLINGLPNETKEMMLQNAAEAARLHPDGIKLQMLHVIEGTPLAEMYSSGRITLLEQDEYIDIIAHQLELLPADTVIERITGDGDQTKLIAPMWTVNKKAVLNGIDKLLTELVTWQGKKYVCE